MKMTKKNKRTYRLLPLSNAMSKIYRNSSGNNDGQFINLMKNWDAIVGREYSTMLSPMKVSSQNSSLTVLSSRNFSLESNYVAPMLLDKINKFYGYKAFKKVDFIFKNRESSTKKEIEKPISSSEKDKIQQIVCNVEDSTLKESLEKLGESMTRKGKIKS
jgi:hypothetical protein